VDVAPANLSMCGDGISLRGYCLELGWLSYLDWQKDGAIWFGRDFVWFWIKNTSAFIPLLVMAHIVRSWFQTGFVTWFAPMWLWFLVPNIIVLQPGLGQHEVLHLLGAARQHRVGGFCRECFSAGPAQSSWPRRCLRARARGGADLARRIGLQHQRSSVHRRTGLEVAEWVRLHTSPTSVFVVAPEHNSPIPTLAAGES